MDKIRTVFRKDLGDTITKKLVFDIECDNLLEELTKMHCFVAFDLVSKTWIKTRDPYEAARILNDPTVEAIGHHIKQYDLPALRKLTGIDIQPGRVRDTLPIAQYLDPERLKHGLEGYGEDFGVLKPKVDDWENLTPEEYEHRCEEDVKINTKVYMSQVRRLKVLYNDDLIMVDEIMSYLTFKFDCLEEQYRNPISLNLPLLFKELEHLTAIRDEVRSTLMEQMPRVIKTGIKKRPAKYYLKDGGPTKAAENWEKLLADKGYTPTEAESIEEVEVVVSDEEPNPDGNEQLKSWLFSLGWEPCTFKFVLDKTQTALTGRKSFRKVPQISDADDKTKLTPSVMRLADHNKAVKTLAGYSTLKHRVGILEGFIRDSRYGKIVSEAQGLTNTLRLKHRIIVNLPKPKAAYAAHIREVLMAPEGYYMVGADLSGIEDNTKQHYIYPLDPEYVISMRTPGFDAHCRIAVLAELFTPEDEEFFKKFDNASPEEKKEFSKEDVARFKQLKDIRGNAKVVNFSATYGVGKKTLAQNGGFTETFAEKLLDTYWGLNWAVKDFAESVEVKTINNQKWVKQPVSGFWYSLRAEKDRFSTTNQSTAVYVFDVWVYFLRQAGIQLSLQYHDEVMFLIHCSIPEEEIRDRVMSAMEKVNEFLNLHIEVKCSLDFGKNYLEVH